MVRRNILWILADELRASALSCYGGAWGPVSTPHIDRLAAGGTLFGRHYANSPVCVPARTSFLTGRAPERTGVYFNEGAWPSFPLPVRHLTFPEHLAAHGWRTASFGKAHLHAAYRPWQECDETGSGMGDFAALVPADRLQAIVPAGIPSPVGGVFPDDLPYPAEAVTRNALDWLSRAAAEGAPFLLRVSYLQPHTPVLPPARFRCRQRAADWPGHRLPRGGGSLYERTFAAIVGGPDLTQEEMAQAQADYHALVEWLDGEVGRLVEAVDALGLAATTAVVLTSDHGASLGENGLLSKVVFAPQSQRVPMILRAPWAVPAGAVDDGLGEAVDLARTVCALAGVEPDAGFEGRSLLDGPPPEMVFSVVGNGAEGSRASSAANVGLWPDGRGWPRRACLRTRRWRFDMNIRQDGGPVRPENEDAFLADSLDDPDERKNLACRPAEAGRVAAFRRILLDRAAGALEPAFVPAYSAAEVGAFAPPRLDGGGNPA
ncbi:MAG: sulfatase-like hydrolase/transferase [Rhodobacteraceae bacterium]|jgi:choline-sulfatase|nr:sulfatase-like hydrolase/transferase [Paracoccaceae bacterium]